MAEINLKNSGGHKMGRGVKKNKKLSTRVDLTPMVDLGFLLITFFIFTTTMSQATAMKLYMPDDKVDSTLIKNSGALTLLLGKDDIIFYEGKLVRGVTRFTTTSYRAIRDLIIEKKSADPGNFYVVIKPQKESVYRNTVDALDEMTINDVKHYSLDDISKVEEELAK